MKYIWLLINGYAYAHSALNTGSAKANQSEACVGNNPIPWHFHIAKAILTRFPIEGIVDELLWLVCNID